MRPAAQRSAASTSAATHHGPPHGKRPHGWLRHYAGLLGPGGGVAAGLAFERNREQRLKRLMSAVGERRRSAERGSMRALLATPGGRLRWQAAPAPPPPGPNGAIVHPIAASTCDLDCALALGATQLPLPLHLGHECVAEVLAVGERVSTVKPGERVIVPFQVSCGECPSCRNGHTGSCTSVPPISMYGFGLAGGHWGGAFSDQLAVPFADAMLVPLPEGIDPAAASGLADNVCDAYRHIAPHLPSLLERDSDAEVLIVSVAARDSLFSGSVALYTGLIALALGARRVVLADGRPHIRAEAERLGMQAIEPRELKRRPPAPLVVDMSFDALPLALASTAPDGICTCSGSLHHSARVPLLLMYGRNMALHVGRTHARALIPSVLELMARGDLNPLAASTRIASFDEAPQALAEHVRGGVIKTVLTE
ncbi:MAG TPA: alcohol dehydrogenase catalytic domain-containing protein [Solirubrobacteraceae bacterium]